MEIEQVLSELRLLIKEGTDKVIKSKIPEQPGFISVPKVNYAIFEGWYTKSLSLLKQFLPDNNEFISKFIKLGDRNSLSNAKACVALLESIVEYIDKGFIKIATSSSINTDIELRNLFTKFHRVARQMRSRYDNRSTLDVQDEYDVQDLLHALLRLFFDDIRPEEWTPSYAGKSARMDFLLKNEKTVIEVKKTRHGLTDKELGDQLIIDVDRYKTHPDCKKLICFVYDPEGKIGNPEGMMRDLNAQHKGFAEVIITPIN